MAYVAITSRLTHDVRSIITRMRDAERSTLHDLETAMERVAKSQELKDITYARLWQPEHDLMNRLSKYDTETRVRVSVSQEIEGREINLVLNLHTKVPCFLVSNTPYDGIKVKLEVHDHPEFQHLIDLRKHYNDLTNRWSSVVTQVTNFLESCKSLNEAVKLWPDVARYIPKEDMERVNKKSERAAKEESDALSALKAIDFDTVNSSTVLARMAGAQV